MTLFFPHIPKCAGTTVQRFLRASGLNIFYDYDAAPSPFPYFANQCEERNRAFRQLDFSPFDIVYGHYPLDRYTTAGDRILLLRDPVERAISAFFFLKYSIPAENAVALARNPAIRKIKDGEMNILQFSQFFKSAFPTDPYICGRDPADFAAVFFTENMAPLFDFLSERFGLSLDVPSAENVNTQKDPVAPETRQELEAILSADIEEYLRFRNYWG